MTMLAPTDSMTDTAWSQASRLAMAGAGVLNAAKLDRLDEMSGDELAELAAGVVRVDDLGVVGAINEAALDLAGVRLEHALGRNFFTDLAPCTNNRLFYGMFRRGVAADAMHLVFFYALTYKLSPTEVKVQLFRSGPDSNWILIRRK
jgi:photoactive yellow protein